MGDEVYDGAIGIDLGMQSFGAENILEIADMAQARPIHVLPTMRAPASRSVSLDRVCCAHFTRLMHMSSVANEQGSFTTPSFVSFTSDERLIGEAAKNQAAMNPANTVFDIK